MDCFFLFDVPLSVVCDEVSAQFERRPGVLQWYAVPWCNQSGLVEDVMEKLSAVQPRILRRSCDTLRGMCDSQSGNYNYDNAFFYCQVGSCATIGEVLNIIAGTAVKPGIQDETCGGCNVTKCAFNCTTSPILSRALAFNDSLWDYYRVQNSIDKVLVPWMDCNKLIDRVLSNVDFCSHLPQGFNLLAISATIAGLSLALGIVVLFMGQKRFFQRGSFDDQKYLREGNYSKVVSLNQAKCEPDQTVIELTHRDQFVAYSVPEKGPSTAVAPPVEVPPAALFAEDGESLEPQSTPRAAGERKDGDADAAEEATPAVKKAGKKFKRRIAKKRANVNAAQEEEEEEMGAVSEARKSSKKRLVVNDEDI